MISIAFTLPVLVVSYFYAIEFFNALRYPRNISPDDSELKDHPKVSILIATYNEKNVIEGSLDAIKAIDYPHVKLQLVVADDSTDETRIIVDRKCDELRRCGIDVAISRRDSRTHFKSGALNYASRLLNGEFVLLLDADSVVPSDVLVKGLGTFLARPSISFVSYRVGHYNRNQNLTTQLYALTLDVGDTLGKMGAYAMNLPFSFQGGFTLITRYALERVGYWSSGTIVEDADLSCKLYESGMQGIYLSNTSILSEDPQSLGVWKKQTARVAQGWAKCLTKHFRRILTSKDLSFGRRLALIFGLLSPIASLSWIVVNFMSALAVVSGSNASEASIFSNPAYVALITAPGIIILAAAMYALYVQGIMTSRNLLLIPLLSYVGFFMLTSNSIGFMSGLCGRTGHFFRTPKYGSSAKTGASRYSINSSIDMTFLIESVLSAAALFLSILVLIDGVWLLSLSLFAFSALTLRSMSLPAALKIETYDAEERATTVIVPTIRI